MAEAQEGSQNQTSCKIYVGNLAWATDENALGSHFSSVGSVKEAVVMRSDGRSRGFGFVTFATPDQAKRAIATMSESELHGRRLRVNVANQQVRTGGTGVGDYTMAGGVPQGGYHYPPAVYPGGGGHPYPAGSYGVYSPQPPHPHGGYMGDAYMNSSTNYTESGPSSHAPMADHRKSGPQHGGYYPAGGSYPYPQGGYGPPPY